MSDNTSSSLKRRIFNVIWTAAGEYDFQPEFTAFFPDGSPDFYMNSIIGYARKWYDRDIMERLFDRLKLSVFRETLDGLLWIALENSTYEVWLRPLLRVCIRHAEQFWRVRKAKAAVDGYEQLCPCAQAAKCRELLGQEPRLISSKERSLYEELKFGGDMTSEDIETESLRIFRKYYHLSPAGLDERSLLTALARIRNSLRHLRSMLPLGAVRTEGLVFGKPSDTAVVSFRSSSAPSSRKLKSPPGGKDLLYIEECFGSSLFSVEEAEKINDALCTGPHKNCRLHFTSGALGMGSRSNELSDAEAQAARNREYYRKHRLLYQRSILRLAEQIRNSLLVHSQPLPVLSKGGIFNPAYVWRATELSDPRVFMDVIREEQADFSVDLLLDASASRIEVQELIAAQAYIIAAALRICGIPIQVSSFMSIRGFTVLRRFCGYESASPAASGVNGDKGLRRIFDYFAAGWNRDGLAFRGIEKLMESSETDRHLLIVLTDASPNDDRKLPPDPSSGRIISLDYSGKAGVENTAEEVRALRKKDIQVMAILNGRDDDTKAARSIYGNDFIRIENIKVSAAAGGLIRSRIERIRR
ncbi:MAG: hypothetical protein ACLSH5_09435 [Christensenellales bacterium]